MVFLEALNDNEVKGTLWKKGRGKHFAFLKPWAQRGVLVHIAMKELHYYDEDEYKGTISLQDTQIELLSEDDGKRAHSFKIVKASSSKKKVLIHILIHILIHTLIHILIHILIRMFKLNFQPSFLTSQRFAIKCHPL